MIVNCLLLILGFVLLIKGADVFVDGASSTALNFKVSKILIGLTTLYRINQNGLQIALTPSKTYFFFNNLFALRKTDHEARFIIQ